MKNVIFVLIICLSGHKAMSQSYLSWVTNNTHLREYPGHNFNSQGIVYGESLVFIYSLDTINEFFRVLDIETAKEGYVQVSFIQTDMPFPPAPSGSFQTSGESTTGNPQLEIMNDMKVMLKIKLNEEEYTILSGQIKTIELQRGELIYFASAPGILPIFGTETLQNRLKYSWRFFIRE